MQKKIIISNPDEPDVIITVDDSSNRFTVDDGNGEPPLEDEVPEGYEQQAADIMSTLADHFGSKVPGRPTTFAREWTKMSNTIGEKFDQDVEIEEIIGALSTGVTKLAIAFDLVDEENVRNHVAGFAVLMLALDHKLGLRAAEKIEEASKE